MQDEGPRREFERLAVLKRHGDCGELHRRFMRGETPLRAHGLKPLAVVRSIAVAVAPRAVGVGLVPATRKALQRAQVIERHRAEHRAKRGICGPILFGRLEIRGFEDTQGQPERRGNGSRASSCSGARRLTTLLHEMQRRQDVRLRLATMCIGVGQGISMIVERK